jgi:hypothetical protein
MRLMAILGLVSAAIAPGTAWAQAMVEVPNAPPPPAPQVVTDSHRAPSRYEVLLDVTPGVAVPLGGSYAADFGPSFTMDGHVGLAIWMRARRFALVPELAVGGTTLATGNGSYQGGSFSRVRGEAAMRVLVPIGHHLVVYPRLAVGGDFFSGSFSYDPPTPASRGPMPTVAQASSFILEAGGGLVGTLGRHFALGAYVGVPVTPSMNVDLTTMQGIRHVGNDRFTAVELTASAVVALRL